MARIAYLGPEGTFSEAALLRMTDAGLIPPGTGAAEPMATDSTPAALDAVRDGSADYACVPIENSIDGTVLATLDNLATGTPLQVLAELTLDVEFSIVVRPGTTADQVRTVAAFPVAAAQVRRWLAEHLPAAQLTAAISNAAAAQDVSAGRADAGVSTALATRHYGLATLADGVVDEPNARTRFVLVGRPAPPPARTGADRTSVVLRLDKRLPPGKNHYRRVGLLPEPGVRTSKELAVIYGEAWLDVKVLEVLTKRHIRDPAARKAEAIASEMADGESISAAYLVTGRSSATVWCSQ